MKEPNEIIMSSIKTINYSDTIFVFKHVYHYFSMQLQIILKFLSMTIIQLKYPWFKSLLNSALKL